MPDQQKQSDPVHVDNPLYGIALCALLGTVVWVAVAWALLF